MGGKGEQRSAGQPLVSVGGGGSGDDDAGWLVELWRTRESLHSNKIGCIHSPIAANELAKLLKGCTYHRDPPTFSGVDGASKEKAGSRRSATAGKRRCPQMRRR